MRIPRFFLAMIAGLAVVFLGHAARLSAQAVGPGEITVHLTAVSVQQTGDEDEEGEYRVKILTGSAVGPFHLAAGESDSFSPGLLMLTRTAYSINEPAVFLEFDVQVMENDGGGNEDLVDDSVTKKIRVRISRPGSTTITRQFTIPSNPEGGKPDRLVLQFRVTSGA